MKGTLQIRRGRWLKKGTLSGVPSLPSVGLGAALALTAVPHAWSALTPLPLAALLWWVSTPQAPRAVAARLFWGMTAFFSLHLLFLPLSFAQLFGVAGALLFPALFVLEGAFYALLGLLVARLTPTFLGRVWGLAFGWVVLEWLRHLGPFAFPWGTLGYTLLPTPLIQVADLGGVLLASLLVTTLAAALASLARQEARPLALALPVWGLALVYGLTRPEPPPPTHRALLVQGNLDPLDKVAGRADPLPIYARLSGAAAGAVAVWPETAISGDDLGRLPDQPLLIGVARPAQNRVEAWDGGLMGAYDKRRRVPFAEYFPLRTPLAPLYERVFRALGVPDPAGLLPGRLDRPLTLGGVAYGAYVCYESVFPGIARGLVRDGAGVLVNVSNDGWFNAGNGVEQHFQMGRVRAIETRRFLLRAGNIGVTAVIDPRGRVTQALPTRRAGALQARFAAQKGTTGYVRLGDWPVGVAALGLLGVVWGRQRPRSDGTFRR
ncbi:apolipoprotein N-acyltransferase (plasmid) [Deinococcus metallilatus]|nr:apolipoprotein N-acyltransferase [Deinococcus metallilatus]RXJ14673.1 apolipoprotein N-acyltransferase [Deinococcus metallilatus]TLK30793.1 apolipoprotein N-acyltransferase [Deinococcus metallilatus]